MAGGQTVWSEVLLTRLLVGLRSAHLRSVSFGESVSFSVFGTNDLARQDHGSRTLCGQPAPRQERAVGELRRTTSPVMWLEDSSKGPEEGPSVHPTSPGVCRAAWLSHAGPRSE